MTRVDTLKLIDFGSAKLTQNNIYATNTVPSENGTHGWKAPETYSESYQWHSSADIYSLGVTLWEIAEQELVPEKVIGRELVKNGLRPPISNDCDDTFKQMITSCWQSEASKRPTAQAILIKHFDAEF